MPAALTSPIGKNEVVINNGNYIHFLSGTRGANGRMTGLVPRDTTRHPRGGLWFAPPFSLQVITDPKEQQDRLTEQIAKKAQASNVRNISGPNNGPIPSRDQNGKGYCWAHSSVGAMMYARAMAGEPYADLSAYMVACIIKGYRDEGGWGSESMEFIAQNGVPTSQFWPQQSMSRSNDNKAMRDNAALHKWTGWMELSSDPNTRWNQMVTCAVLNIPVVSDFNWWSHSVFTIDIVDLARKSTRIQNSWGDSWSENGTGVLEYPKSIPDDAWAALIPTPSAA